LEECLLRPIQAPAFERQRKKLLDGLRTIEITPQARLSILEREVGYA
jgi:hypothetical protein